MSYAGMQFSTRILAIRKNVNRLLSVLRPYYEKNIRIPFNEEDYKSINITKQFLEYAVQGWDLEKLFQYDPSFFITPGEASRLSLEIIVNKIGYPNTINEITERCKNYLEILNKFGDHEGMDREKLKETITFLGGLRDKAEKVITEKLYGIKYPNLLNLFRT